MPVRSRCLGEIIEYLFNGREFVVNTKLPREKYDRVMVKCLENHSALGSAPGKIIEKDIIMKEKEIICGKK